MSQNGERDLEGGQDADHPRNQSVSTQNQQLQPSQGESNFGDSSGPLFSMYSKAAEEEDNKMADRWQKDADGILIFTGLFSAAVATLLSVSVQNLIPNSQDTSSFYLGNIYEVLADPNAIRASTPPSVVKPPPFSPPTYAIWVNSLWFLSLVISLTCALLATSSHQWSRRYIRVTQPARCSPEKRARMRAFFANGMENMHIVWVVEGLPTLVHLSLFLFFGGLVIFLFNINRAVFNSVVWWIGLFLIVYGLITLMPILRHDSPFFSPLSLSAWFLYASISYLFLKVLFSIKSDRIVVFRTWQRLRASKDRYRGWILGGLEDAAEETVSKRSSEIDVNILGWTIDALDDDDRLERFFEAIPGFFNSKLVKDLKKNFSNSLLKKFWRGSDGFLDRTILSNFAEPVKSRRLDVGMNAMSVISISHFPSIPHDILLQSWDQVPQDVEMGYTLTRWCTSDNKDIAQYANCIASRILASVQTRDDRWIGLATRVLGLSERSIRDYISHGNDSVSLAILISVARRDLRSDFYDWGMLWTLSELNIHNTLPGLRHDFCALWNESVQEALEQGPDSYPVGVLRLTRAFYIGLHQDTHVAPTKFSASTRDFDHILFQPESYPLCDIPGHHPETSQPPTATSPALPVHTIPSPGDVSRSGGIAAALQDITPTVTLSYFLETNKQQDIVAPLLAPDICQIPFTKPPSSPAPASSTQVRNEPLASYDAGPSTPKLSPPASSTTTTPPPSHILPLPNAELLDFLSGKSLSSPPDNASLSHLRARGLINKGNMCFINAVFQLLVYCPPFWNQFRDLGGLMDQRELEPGNDQQTDGGMTVLVDATVKFLAEFVSREKEDSGTDPFIPAYMYDAMKEKRQFKNMLDGRQQDAEESFSFYLNALEEELLSLLVSISTQRPAGSVKSPISRIFDGKFRTIVRMAGQPDTVTIESWRSLQLDIQSDSIHTIQDALAHISQPQSVPVSPSGPSKANQQVTVLIEAVPPVLVLHLKRFLYDAATAGGVVKIAKPVRFSPELEVPSGIIASAAGQLPVPARYTLCGVLYHQGASASRGHYTVDVLHPNAHDGGGEAWLHIDDESVITVRHEDVFGGHDNERAHDESDRCAYMLFYHRATSTET